MSPRVVLSLAAAACCALVPFAANAQTPVEQFSKAAVLYANPSKDGLQGYHCDVKTNWAEALSKASGTPLTDTNPFIVALNATPMTVDDDLKGIGQVHWDLSKTPDVAKGPIQMMQDGVQQMWHGFFQSWNEFMTGSLVTVSSDKIKVERNPDGGFHVFETNGNEVNEESFDQNLLMKSLHVKDKQMEVTMTPEFMDTPQGKLVTGMDSDYSMQPGTPPIHLIMQIKYAMVSGYSLPSEIHIVAGPSDLRFTMSGCVVNPVPAK